MADFNLGFDPHSIAEIVRLMGFRALLLPEVVNAFTDAGKLLVEKAQAKTWQVFANPTGALAASIYSYVVSPEEMIVAVGVPYGRRREYGFSGMTDALGRFYPNDPAKPYLAPALEASLAEILRMFWVAHAVALDRVGA